MAEKKAILEVLLDLQWQTACSGLCCKTGEMVEIRLCSNISVRPPVTITVVNTERSNMCSQCRSANEGLQKEVNVKWDDCIQLTPQLNTTIGNRGCQIVESPTDAHLSHRVICQFQDVIQQFYRNFVNAGHFNVESTFG